MTLPSVKPELKVETKFSHRRNLDFFPFSLFGFLEMQFVMLTYTLNGNFPTTCRCSVKTISLDNALLRFRCSSSFSMKVTKQFFVFSSKLQEWDLRRQWVREKEKKDSFCVIVRVRVCVRERERGRESVGGYI